MVELPEQIEVVPVILVGAVGAVVTLTVTEAQLVVVVLQGELPTLRT